MAAFDRWDGRPPDAAAGPGLGLHVWREHLALWPDRPGRALGAAALPLRPFGPVAARASTARRCLGRPRAGRALGAIASPLGRGPRLTVRAPQRAWRRAQGKRLDLQSLIVCLTVWRKAPSRSILRVPPRGAGAPCGSRGSAGPPVGRRRRGESIEDIPSSRVGAGFATPRHAEKTDVRPNPCSEPLVTPNMHRIRADLGLIWADLKFGHLEPWFDHVLPDVGQVWAIFFQILADFGRFRSPEMHRIRPHSSLVVKFASSRPKLPQPVQF